MASRTKFGTADHSSHIPLDPTQPSSKAYGLRRGILSPFETLAQSVSTIAPTATPAATIPLVCALAGNGTWLACNLYPVPEGPYGKLPYIYLGYLGTGMLWLLFRGNSKASETSQT